MSADLQVRPLTKTQARRLTEKIAGAAEALWSLLLEAKDGRAWEALGYDTWDAYVAAEFGMSRGQSYRLLDQGRVIGELAAATGVTASDIAPAVSARQAATLKPVLPEVAERAREAVKGTRRAARPEIVAGVVDEATADVARARHAEEETVEPEGAQSVEEEKQAAVDVANAIRLASAAAAIPKLIRFPVRDVVEAMPLEGRGEIAKRLRVWAVEFEAEARGFAKVSRDHAAARQAPAVSRPINPQPKGRR
jgi:hypothetical protein